VSSEPHVHRSGVEQTGDARRHQLPVEPAREPLAKRLWKPSAHELQSIRGAVNDELTIRLELVLCEAHGSAHHRADGRVEGVERWSTGRGMAVLERLRRHGAVTGLAVLEKVVASARRSCLARSRWPCCGARHRCAASAVPCSRARSCGATAKPTALVAFCSGSEHSYDQDVTEQAQAVLATALRLTLEERAQLAAELLASLDGEADEDVDAAWAVEIERRVQRLEEEGSRGRPWQEVFDGYRRQP
jgi:putative addiction module component (TIGR02574 family)